MDSVSHIVIGAAIGEAVVGKKIGRWAMLIGAIAKSLPDFDLFYTGLKDPRGYMCVHRGHTHSLIWEALYAIPLAYGLSFLFNKKVSFLQFYGLLFACLWGHSLLDWCTNFGTQLLLPFTNQNYSLNNLAIVDLLFTLPMLLMMLVAIFLKSNFRFALAKASLIYCGLYLAGTFVNKCNADNTATKALAKCHIPATAYITNPTILNNVLWYVMASNDSMIYTAEFSLLHPSNPINWHSYPRAQYLMDSSKSIDDVARLRWHGGPYTIAQPNGDTLNVYTVKFGRTNMQETGIEKSFEFYYQIYKQNDVWQLGMHEPTIKKVQFNTALQDMWERICGRRY